MAAKTAKGANKSGAFFTDERIKFITGILISGFALYLLLACISYLIWWKTDQSLPPKDVISGADIEVKNWSGKSGLFLAKMIITYGFGFGAFFLPLIIGTVGLYLLSFPNIKPLKLIVKFTFAAIILSLILGFVFGKSNVYLGSGPGGAQGYIIARWLNAFMGMIGTGVILTSLTITYLIFALKVKPESFGMKLPAFLKSRRVTAENKIASEELKPPMPSPEESDEDEIYDEKEGSNIQPVEFIVKNTNLDIETYDHDQKSHELVPAGFIINDLEKEQNPLPLNNVPIDIRRPGMDDNLSDREVERIMENYDPRLDLSHYKFPPVSILKEHKSETAFDNTEVFENKENIIKTLGDHKISIKSITATIGPTVTLYEIVPERGVRLARIKSLEDDIALNLSALGIRIIAPIPGRGTVGIEVPNKKPEMVSMKSLITSKAFQETKFDIALALGRTITNEPFIVDLTKMPHLLVAGATGQGKSVGINAIITSILYKKHPAEVKFVLIDPKRVELPLYMKIERHFLAKLPGEEDAILTDT
ncbi:MAG: DNA translocase FtsK 4TM domain-containing protein, partial [Bacteroidota bacterium]